jgi:hypothetical protein
MVEFVDSLIGGIFDMPWWLGPLVLIAVYAAILRLVVGILWKDVE